MPQKTSPIEAILKDYAVLILDGALATELEKHGCDLDDPLWSARILLENPELIYQVHSDYFRSGADCAITASYQATIEGFAQRGIAENEALELIKNTVHLARKARDDYWKEEMTAVRPKPLVAASVGPYGAFLADGSEYTGDYTVSRGTLSAFHRSRISALIDAGADLLAFETIPSFDEAKVLASLLNEFPDTYAWLSFSLKNENAISDGTLIEECVKAFEENNQIASIGINCAPVSIAAEAIRVIRKHSSKPIIVYPNSGESYDPETKTWDGQKACTELDLASDDWFNAGARLIGGCCRTSPEQIEKLAKKWRTE